MNSFLASDGSVPPIISHTMIKRFGDLTGDKSAIHFDSTVGRAAGYGGPIAHGLLTASIALGEITRNCTALMGVGNPNVIQSDFSLRLKHVVCADDTLSVRVLEDPTDTKREDTNAYPSISESQPSIRFETLNQRNECSSSGEIWTNLDGLASREVSPTAWALSPWSTTDKQRTFYAEDLVESGPRGRSEPRSVLPEQVDAYAKLVGECNPLYLDADFAGRSKFGQRLVPPMLSFSWAFGDFLRDLLSVKMPAEGFAGHIGDHWRLWEPIRVGDTLHTRHRPIESTLSRQRPELAIVRFGLQVINQKNRVVQDGETILMIPTRESLDITHSDRLSSIPKPPAEPRPEE